ncbi:7-cyano-7-deazaguanine synthase [Halorhabdus amylolytica]|uniref:7-cyano-7-deazaguanine synthase n=1 Tax=Halorhabdus amylolytica TaxID=2559573 RepID=UPI0020BF04D2|nr:7-cyano-7-deazaguanine synthase [Halorhabdus amylolytica]
MIEDHLDVEIPDRVVVMLSGGIDSTTLVYALERECEALRAVTINYGQRAFDRSYGAINRLSVQLDVPVECIEAPQLIRSQAGFVEHMHEGYRIMQTEAAAQGPDPSEYAGSCAGTALSGVYAYHVGFDAVAEGANAEDMENYPKRREIHESVSSVLSTEGTEFTIFAPFHDMSRAEVVELADDLDVPLEATWSCWEDEVKHCGECPGCRNRKERFASASVDDPTEYH